MSVPNINIGQIAIDPVNKVFYFKKLNGELVSSSLDWLQNGYAQITTDDDVVINASLTVEGNLVVNGTTTTINSEEVLIEDNVLILNSNALSPMMDAGIQVNRGSTEYQPSIVWDESAQKWTFSNDGNYFSELLITNLSTPSTGQYLRFNGDEWINEYLIGDLTGTVSDISNHGISDLSDVVINDAANGDFLRYNGSNWINDPVNLTTDTVGDYVSTVVSGLGISVTGSGGEGSTPNVALNAVLDNLNDVVISGATPGQTLQFDGTNWVNTVSPTMEPIGFENKSQSSLSFNEATRELTISPTLSSYVVWCAGKKFVKTSAETIQISNDSALHFVFFDSEGRLGTRQSYFNWESEAPVSYVYWNSTDQKAYFFADERHGIVLDWATHEYLHRTRGAAIANGFGVNNYTITGLGTSNADAQIDIANGTFFDEDLQVDIVHSATPTANTWEQRLQGGSYIPVFYRLNNHWKKDTATQFPLKQGTSRPQYNLNSGGTWSTVDVANNRFAISWIIATNNLNEPIIAVLGQEDYGDKGSAEADFYGSLDLSGFPVVEFRPLYKIIYECKDSYTNTPKAAFRTISDLRSVIAADQGVSAVAVSDHGSLTGLVDDDHTQYLTGARHDALDHSTALGTASIDDLSDVTITSPSSNQGLIWNGSTWINQNIPLDLDGLSDVVINSATPNQVLKFDGANWVNASAPGSSIEGTTYLTTIGNGSNNTFVLNHGLSTRDLIVTFTEASAPYASFLTTWEATDLNNITVYFENPPATNSIRVSIYAAVSGTTANVSSINDIGDVTITSATPGQALVWDGSNWVNSVISGGGGGSVNSYAETIGDSSSLSYVLTHSLGTRDIILQARNVNSPYEFYNVAWESTTINTATVYFDAAPATNSVRIKIVA
jgi:hypothetical protein